MYVEIRLEQSTEILLSESNLRRNCLKKKKTIYVLTRWALACIVRYI